MYRKSTLGQLPPSANRQAQMYTHVPNNPEAWSRYDDTVEQSVCWRNGLDSAEPGKACTFSGFDYRDFQSLMRL